MKGLLVVTGWWLRTRKPTINVAHQQKINEDNSAEHTSDQSVPSETQNNNAVVRAVPQIDGQEPLQQLQEGLDKLVEKLQGINGHLSHRAAQHKDLMTRIEQLPEKLESFPAAVENQKQITRQILEQLETSAEKSDDFLEAVEKIPNETAKRTDALVNINHQISTVVDIDVQMNESLNNFKESINKLNQSTVDKTDGIIQMSETFAAGDNYLKHIISRQNKHLMWNMYYGKILWNRIKEDPA
jgi:methyl-accepting chemotaxis protein